MKKIITILIILNCFLSISQVNKPGWLLNGNSSTNPPTQFIGTIDSKDLVFKTNNVSRFIIGSAGTYSYNGYAVNYGLGGTVVYTTSLGSYVPYTGATNSLVMGANAIVTPTIFGSSAAGGTLNLIGTSNASGGFVNIAKSSSTVNVLGVANFDNNIILANPTNTNFIGTTTNRSLLFRTNNVNRIKVDSLGNSSFVTVIQNNQNTVSKFRIANSSASILDIGDNNEAGSVYFWANRNSSKTASNYNIFMDHMDMLLNDSSSVQIRLQGITAFAITNPRITGLASDFAALTPPSFQKTTLQESRSFRILSRTQGFNAGGTLALQRNILIEATTYTSSSASTITNLYTQWNAVGIAGSGVTIGNNWGIGTNGSAHITQSLVIGAAAKTPTATLDVTGNAAISSSLTVGGPSTLTGQATLSNTLNILGNTILSSNATATLTSGNTGTIAVLTDAVFTTTHFHSAAGPFSNSTSHFDKSFVGVSGASGGTGLTYIPVNCTLIGYTFTSYVSGTLGSAGSSTVSCRVNNTTDIQLTATQNLTAITNISTSSVLNTNLTAGDYIEIKIAVPTLGTPATNVSQAATLFFRRR